MKNRIGSVINLGIGRSAGTDFNLFNNYEELDDIQTKLVEEIVKESLINFAS